MAQLTIQVNGRAYTVGCEDGQENHLRELAGMVDAQVRQVGQDVGNLGEVRLMLMAALMLADDLSATKAHISSLNMELVHLKSELDNAERTAVNALEAAANKIETLATS